MARLLLAAAFLAAASGCAKGYVVAQDRAALWNAGLMAIAEEQFAVARADEPGGIIEATRSLAGDGGAGEKLRLTMTFERAGGEYRAAAVVRRSSPRLERPAVDYAVRLQRGSEGGTGRTMEQYGTVPARDMNLERAILQRMRRLLAAAP